MTFATPLWLWALLAVPLLALAEAWAWRRDRARTERLVSYALWGRVVRRTPASLRFTRLALVLVGATALVLALARPQWGVVRERVEREGVDVVLVLDTSKSMGVADVPPDRFFLARQGLMNLVTRLNADRFGLVAFESEAYPLVPLTLDADAVGLFLDTLEPGAVPGPGTSLGAGLARGMGLFVDKDRRNKVMVLVSDGEDLENEVDDAVAKAKEQGVIVHTVLVGTEQGQPVPEIDDQGRRVGFKKDENGQVVISHAHPETLEAIARGTGGKAFRLTGSDTTLAPLAAAIEGMEQKTLAREWSYRKKERFQVPLGVALLAMALALLLPLPPLRRRAAAPRAVAAVMALALLLPPHALAQSPAPPAAEPPPAPAHGGVIDELTLAPPRLTDHGRTEYQKGNHPEALKDFSGAATVRPRDPGARFNLGDAYYKNGRWDDAGAIYRTLGNDAKAPLAGASRYNLGNTLYQKQDYKGAVDAYRQALGVMPGDLDTRKNLEMALRALQKQQEQQQKQQQDKQGGQGNPQPQSQGQEPKKQPSQGGPQGPPKSQEQQEKERFEKEAGMPKERADQLLDALQQDEKGEQKKQLARKNPPPGQVVKDW